MLTRANTPKTHRLLSAHLVLGRGHWVTVKKKDTMTVPTGFAYHTKGVLRLFNFKPQKLHL